MEGKRLMWVDSLRGWLIILVVLGHAIQDVLGDDVCFNNHLWNLIYSFHMPAFMALSGYLNYRPGSPSRLNMIWRRFQQLLVPYFIWCVIKLLLSTDISIDSFCGIILMPDRYFWFLWVLFFISILFQVGGWFAEKLRIKEEIVMVSICVILVLLMVFVDIRVMGFQYIAYYYLFYTFGYIIHKHKYLVITTPFPVLVLVFIWAALAWFWKMHELPFFLSSIPLPASLVQYCYRFLTAIVFVYALFGFGPTLFNGNFKGNLLIAGFGKVSLGIYVIHLLIMPYIVDFLSLSFNNHSIIIFIAFCLAFNLSWFIVWLLGKNNYASRLLLGKI